MKPSYALDTHALIWHLQSATELSPKARQIFSKIDAGNAIAIIPIIVLVEMIYLKEKARISGDLLKAALTLLGKESENYQLAPLNFSITKNLERIPYRLVPDMPDRLIATTALTLNIPLLSRDTDIANVSEIEVIW